MEADTMKPLNVIDIECPVCGAEVGEQCTGRPRDPWHRARLRAIVAKVIPAKSTQATVTPMAERRAA